MMTKVFMVYSCFISRLQGSDCRAPSAFKSFIYSFMFVQQIQTRLNQGCKASSRVWSRSVCRVFYRCLVLFEIRSTSSRLSDRLRCLSRAAFKTRSNNNNLLWTAEGRIQREINHCPSRERSVTAEETETETETELWPPSSAAALRVKPYGTRGKRGKVNEILSRH